MITKNQIIIIENAKKIQEDGRKITIFLYFDMLILKYNQGFMHLSKYIELIEDKEKYYLYNSLTNFLAEIDVDFFTYLDTIRKQKKEVLITDVDEELWDTLCVKKVFTENDDDDILLYKAAIKAQRKIDNVLLLTIAPTMDCNFYCPYCFETKEKGVMNDTLIDNIFNWINSYNQLEHINITWFGGEPLLAPYVIQKITNKILSISSLSLKASIITNGYYLTETNIKLLEDSKVGSIQVSIDGLEEQHNRKRFTKTDKNTFATILKNIDTFHQIRPNIKMVIRVGIDKDNINEYTQIHDFFYNRYQGNPNIAVAPGLIVETTKSCVDSCISDAAEKFKLHKEFTIKTGSSHFIYPSNSIIECAVRNTNSWAIDAKGDLYKCWEILGNKKYKVGELTENGIAITNQTNLNRYLYGADPLEDNDCNNCFSLPICGGGCPHKRIENKFNEKQFNLCTYFKDNLRDYISLKAKIINNTPSNISE